MRKIAVVLSGCGFKDGTEITEAISTFIALSEARATYSVFAPDLSFEATDHLTGESSGQRSVLAEAARISRGQISKLSNLIVKDFDGLVFPGGYGAAKILCSFGVDGAKGKVMPDVLKIVREFHSESKPICALCIAPSIIALALGKQGVTVTIGNDPSTAAEIIKTGAQHENCVVDDFITDRENKVITAPAYMYDDASAFEVFKGVRAAIRELVEMA